MISISACGPPQDTRAEPVATSTATPGLEATVQLLASRIAASQKLVVTSDALETQAALRQTAPIPPTVLPETPTPIGPTVQTTPTIAHLPPDIPLPPGAKRDLFTSNNLISFLIQTDFTPLILFYENQMPANHWVRQSSGSFIIDSSALLYYAKDNRSVSISLRANPISGLVGVVITLQH